MAQELEPATPQAAGLSSEGLARVDAAVQAQVDAGVIAGAVVLVARHGKVAHTATFGVKDLERREPPALDTMFRIYSMTKPVTGVAMMILHDEGRWSPDDPVEKHLPEWAGVKVFDGLDADGAVKLAQPDHPPTVRELLTHTVGLGYGGDPAQPVDKLYQAADIWRAGGLEEFSRRVAGLPLYFQPGTKWLYGLGMDIQGALIERLTGQSLPDFMHERIFAPLGMADTAFHLPPEKRHRLATLYRASESRGLVPMTQSILPLFEAPPKLASGGGGLISTAPDYARFAQMLLNGGTFEGRRIVSAEGLKLMMSNHLPDWMLTTGFGIGKQQIRPGFGYGFDGAVFTDPAAAGVPVGEGTYHWDGAAGTWFWVDPVNDLLYVGLIQLMSPNGPALQKTTQTLMAGAIV
ncbi:MAG: beta-lactamase family protein [Caulobacteraceae bacterium]|nr:beta-lactamase family protein [Caulobacteraceae bacterium]